MPKTFTEMFQARNDELETFLIGYPAIARFHPAASQICQQDMPIIEPIAPQPDRQFKLCECDTPYGDYPGEVCYGSGQTMGGEVNDVWLVGGRVTAVISEDHSWLWSGEDWSSFSSAWRKDRVEQNG